MTFYADSNNEFFTLSASLSTSRGIRLYWLTEQQQRLARCVAPKLFSASLAIFCAVLAVLIGERSGVNRVFFDAEQQEVILLVLGACALIFGFVEIFFFLWIRRENERNIVQPSRHVIERCRIVSKLSWTVYATFLLNLMLPCAAIVAMPGGIERFLVDLSVFSNAGQLFVCQLGLVLIIFCAVLIFKIVHILRHGPRQA